MATSLTAETTVGHQPARMLIIGCGQAHTIQRAGLPVTLAPHRQLHWHCTRTSSSCRAKAAKGAGGEQQEPALSAEEQRRVESIAAALSARLGELAAEVEGADPRVVAALLDAELPAGGPMVQAGVPPLRPPSRRGRGSSDGAAVSADGLPEGMLPKVAIIGRPNVGKSGRCAAYDRMQAGTRALCWCCISSTWGACVWAGDGSGELLVRARVARGHGLLHKSHWPVAPFISSTLRAALFNRIVGQQVAIVYDSPGVTRDRLYTRASWGSREFMLVDTGGLMSAAAKLPQDQQVGLLTGLQMTLCCCLPAAGSSSATCKAHPHPSTHPTTTSSPTHLFTHMHPTHQFIHVTAPQGFAMWAISAAGLPMAIERQAAAAAAEADVLVLVVDGQSGGTAADEEILAWLRRMHPDKPLVLAVNKCENTARADLQAAEFWSMGLDPLPVSAISGSGEHLAPLLARLHRRPAVGPLMASTLT